MVETVLSAAFRGTPSSTREVKGEVRGAHRSEAQTLDRVVQWEAERGERYKAAAVDMSKVVATRRLLAVALCSKAFPQLSTNRPAAVRVLRERAAIEYVEVVSVQENAGKAEAAMLYREIAE